MVTNLSLASVLLESLHLLWIRSAVAESPIDGDQLGMRNRYDGTLTPTPQLQSLVTHLEKGLLVRRSSPCRLRQGCPQPAVALSCSSAFSLAGALIVAWTNRPPGCQMMTIGKRSLRTHVHSCLGQAAGRCSRLDSWYRARQFHLLLIGFQPHRDFFIQFLDHLFDIAHVPERLTDHEAVIIAHPMTFQRFYDLRNLWRQAPVSQFGDFCSAPLVFQQRFLHRLTRSPKHIRQ